MPDDRPGSRTWRTRQLDDLLRFARGSRVAGGFAWLDGEGRPDPGHGLPLWINARMTYVFSLAHLLGAAGSQPLAEHGVAALRTTFADPEHGGWFSSVGSDGTALDGAKSCYDHSFVLLAACTAQAAQLPGARELLDAAAAVHEARFWDVSVGRCREEWSRDWTRADPYRGANSNMHALEAYLFTADATGDPRWRQRALSIAEFFIDGVARSNDWRLVEHFDEEWAPLRDYNRDRPDDPFRPFGATPGHGLEWARLLVHLEAALPDPPPWLLPAAEALFHRAVDDSSGGGSGFPYTTDWDGTAIVTERFHWVLAEAVLAADALGRRTGDTEYADLAGRWWELADTHFADPQHGSWHHELDAQLRPSSRTWAGKPDAFHVMNALVMPDLPLAPTAPRTAGLAQH